MNHANTLTSVIAEKRTVINEVILFHIFNLFEKS